MGFQHPQQRAHMMAGRAAAATSAKTPDHLRSFQKTLSQGGGMAKDKLFSTSNKQRRTQPAQVLRTTNPGVSSLQTQTDTDPFTDNEDTVSKTPKMPRTGKAPASPVAQRPRTVATSNLRKVIGAGRAAITKKESGPGIVKRQTGKNLKWQRKTKGPGAAFYGQI